MHFKHGTSFMLTRHLSRAVLKERLLYKNYDNSKSIKFRVFGKRYNLAVTNIVELKYTCSGGTKFQTTNKSHEEFIRS